MRGALIDSGKPPNTAGIIPAYAGSTSHEAVKAGRVRDHPRVCGEHHDYLTAASRYGGSSPRMRGALHVCGVLRILTGIIPAYAGSTVTASRPPARSGDHPRVCGEHRHRGLGDLPRQGSSPRMRGAHSGLCSERAQCGIIPAYAGSTLRAVQ